MLIVSHSEVDQYLSCERKHYYAFGKKLQGARTSDSLQRGTMGHAVLEAYYKTLQTTKDPDQARLSGFARLAEYIRVPGIDLGLLSDLQELCARYFDYAPTLDETFEILYVEEEFRLNITDEIEYPYKPDLIVKDKATGRIYVIDHKFLYNFYQVDDMKISPQLAKYMGALRANGINVHSGLYNMLRWRKVKDISPEASFKREGVKITNTRIAITFREQVEAMEQIGALKVMPLRDWEKIVLRTASSFNCKNCSFLNLCTLDLDGQDTTMAEKYDYVPNTYHYDQVESL
jgi:hypothetical protein